MALSPKHLLIPLLTSLSTPLFAVERFFDFGIDLGYEDNVGRAQQAADIISDQMITTFGSASFNVQLGERSGVTFKALAEYVKHDKLSGLDHYNLGLSANLRLKPNLAYTAPWFSLGAKLTKADYLDSQLRDGYLFDLEAMVGKRFTDRILAKAGIGYSNRTADQDNSPFDHENRRLFAGLDYHYKKLTFYGQYTYQDGPVVSTSGPNPYMGNYYQIRQYDDAIGYDANGKRRYAYRIDADTRITDLGVNYAISRSTALDLMLRQVESEAGGNNRYDNFSAHAGLFFRFK